jgi:hypothetical protein
MSMTVVNAGTVTETGTATSACLACRDYLSGQAPPIILRAMRSGLEDVQ